MRMAFVMNVNEEAAGSSWVGLNARPGQSLFEHSSNVSERASWYARKCGANELMRITGFLHDYGKVTSEFQRHLNKDKKSEREIVQHAIYGAKRIFDMFKTNSALLPIAEALANIIAAHHGSLYDNIDLDGSTPLLDRVINADELSILALHPDVDIEMIKAEFAAIVSKMPKVDKIFYVSMLTKYLYSCLVDADRLDANPSEREKPYESNKPDWNGMLSTLERKLAEDKTHLEIDRIRTQISDDCKIAGSLGIGIYKLEAPTGGGKTLSSLRFALEHARIHDLDKIIYIIPYLTILNQVATEIRSALKADENTVLEHHSDITPDEPEYYKLHTDRWDAPIVLSSQVQFLESIFSAKGSDLRKMHNMSRSVIIFDEVQSLPVKCVHLFNGALNFLNSVCESTVLLCTATQPLLDTVKRPILLTSKMSIAGCVIAPKRYNIINKIKLGGYSYSELATFIDERHVNSTLAIVNTKAAAKLLYEELKRLGMPVLHLSTNMCSAHRDNVLDELHRRLKAKEPVICISTQLIEAGVNISFECVIRDIAGLDNIYQAAGRCNRHGEFGESKNVYIINIKGENLERLPDIKSGADSTMRLLAESLASNGDGGDCSDINNDKADNKSEDGRDRVDNNDGGGGSDIVDNLDINLFYKYYFCDRHSIMDYPISGNGSIYDLLSANQQGCNAYKDLKSKQGIVPPALRSAIRTAGKEFFVIERGRKEVIVPYGEYNSLLSQYESTVDIYEKRKLLRKLGKLSVSLYEYQIDALFRCGALYEQEGMTVIMSGFYNNERGVDLDGNHDFLNA